MPPAGLAELYRVARAAPPQHRKPHGKHQSHYTLCYEWELLLSLHMHRMVYNTR